MRYISALLMLLCTLSVSAQIFTTPESVPQNNYPQYITNDTTRVETTHKTIKEHLATPIIRDTLPSVYETVNVIERGDAANIVEQNLVAGSKKINGFRVVLFISNAQNARQEAIATQNKFTELQPDEPTYIIYDNPYFKVFAGNCTSFEEAKILLGRIVEQFPKAFIMREQINIEEFTK